MSYILTAIMNRHCYSLQREINCDVIGHQLPNALGLINTMRTWRWPIFIRDMPAMRPRSVCSARSRQGTLQLILFYLICVVLGYRYWFLVLLADGFTIYFSLQTVALI